MALLGADTDELREVGKEFEEGKEITDDVIKFIQALIIALKAASFFSGGASAAYAEYLETTVLPWLQKISQALGLFAQVLNGQAQQQDDTSSTSSLPGGTPSYTPATNLPAAIQPFTGGSIVGGTSGTSGTSGTGGTSASPSGTTAPATPTTVAGATSTPGGSALGTGTQAGQTPQSPLQTLQQLGQLATTLSHLGDPSSTGAGTTGTTPVDGTSPVTSPTTPTTGTDPTNGTTSTGTTSSDNPLGLSQPHFTVDPSNGHLMLDTGIDTNGPDQPGTTTGLGTATPATPVSPAAPIATHHFGTHAIGTTSPAGGLDPHHAGGGGLSQPSTVGGPDPASSHTPSHAGTPSGAAPSGSSPTSAPTSTSAGTTGAHTVSHAGTPFTAVSHAQPLGTGTPGGEHLASTGLAAPAMGHAAPAAAVTGQHTSYGAAAGIAGGAAVLGLGGAAVAYRGTGGTAGATGAGEAKIDSLAATTSRGSRGEDVKDLQQRLTAAGYDTKGADGVWGRNTEAAYDAYRADHPLPVQSGQGYVAPDGYDYTKITGIQGNANVTPQFLRGVEAMSQRLGAKPEHILAAMSFETGGTFSPSVKNPHSSATGLIQFMDSTAQRLGTSTHELSQMTPTQQLPYVERYFEPYRGRLGDLDRVYTTILAGHPATGDTPLFTHGSAHTGAAYTANAPLDADHDGVVTADEAAAKPASRMH